jgi:glycosyltransferase involved in cell wall biosynthesis
MKKISSYVVTGTGVIRIHQELAKNIRDYKLFGYSPKYEYFPPALMLTKKIDADLIHVTPDHGVYFMEKGTPSVVTFHNYYLDAFMKRHSTLAQRLHYSTDLKFNVKKAVEKASIVTVVNEYLANLIREDLKYTKDIICIPNGVDTDRFKLPDNKYCDREITKILFSGNFTKRKGGIILKEIVPELPDGVKIIVTDDQYKKDKYKINSDKISFIGKLPWHEMPGLYNKVDALFLPSLREGMSLAILEAMASGLPIIASDIDANSSIVTNQGGVLCEYDDIGCYSEAIDVIATNFEMREVMGKHNRKTVLEKYNINTMINSYNELFESIP